MTNANDGWNEFCDRASAVMRDALENRMTLEQASDFFEHDETISNPDLRRYVEYIIWEIDGSPGYYKELLELFASRASEEELVKYLSSK
jgi:hypothetical protein